MKKQVLRFSGIRQMEGFCSTGIDWAKFDRTKNEGGWSGQIKDQFSTILLDQNRSLFAFHENLHSNTNWCFQLDGKIDGTQIGDVVRAAGLKPTNAAVWKAAGQEYKRKGEKRFAFEEWLPIYEQLTKEKVRPLSPHNPN